MLHVDPLTGHQRSDKRLAERLRSPKTPPSLLPALRCMAHYAPFFHPDPKGRNLSKKYDKSVVHSLAIFQALYFAAHALNALLGGGAPLGTEHVGRLYCGTFVYNFLGSLTKRPAGVNELTHLPEQMNADFVSLFAQFESRLQCLKDPVSSGFSVKKAKKASRTEEVLMEVPAPDLSVSDESDYCDFENKFAALAVN